MAGKSMLHAYAAKKSSRLLFDAWRPLFPRLLELQRVEYETGPPSRRTTLPPEYRLENFVSFQTSNGYLNRLSRVINSGESP